MDKISQSKLPKRLERLYSAGLSIVFAVSRDASAIVRSAYRSGIATAWTWGPGRPFANKGPLPPGFSGPARWEDVPYLGSLPWPGPSIGVVTGVASEGSDTVLFADVLDATDAEIRCRSAPLLLVVVLQTMPEAYHHIGPVLWVAPPSQPEREEIVRNLVAGNGFAADDATIRSTAQSLAGLESSEIRQIVLSQLASTGTLDPEMAGVDKSRRLIAGGLLEPIPTRPTAVGGLSGLRRWLESRARAVQRGFPLPKGIVLVGPPDVGKSLSAQMVSQTFSLPLVRLDFGRLYGSYVGESEKNLRTALGQAESMAPTILWIDEIEKGLSGFSGVGGSEITRRLLQRLLTWMAEQQGVFVYATANDIGSLPPELLRKGRFAEIFFADLPTPADREEILVAALDRAHLDPSQYDVGQLVTATEGFSGAEIAAAVEDALYESDGPPAQVDLLRVIRATRALSVVAPEQIAAIRAWGAAHARPAGGSPESVGDSAACLRS